MATLKDLLTETYDIYIDKDKYFCVPKYGLVDKEFDYEMRDIAELNCEMGQIFNNNRNSINWNSAGARMFSTDGIMSIVID